MNKTLYDQIEELIAGYSGNNTLVKLACADVYQRCRSWASSHEEQGIMWKDDPYISNNLRYLQRVMETYGGSNEL